MVSRYRIIRILHNYISNDLDSADPSYVREVLVNVCGCTAEEIVELELDGLWPDGVVNLNETD